MITERKHSRIFLPVHRHLPSDKTNSADCQLRSVSQRNLTEELSRLRLDESQMINLSKTFMTLYT